MSGTMTRPDILLALTILIPVLVVPLLVAVALVGWLRRTRRDLPAWRSTIGVIGIFLTLTTWFLFVVGILRGWIGGFGSHYLTRPTIANWCLIVSLLGLFFEMLLKKPSRLCAGLAGVLVLLLWFGSEMVA